MYTMYLAGQISKDESTYMWRNNVVERYKEDSNVLVINPCNNTFNKKVLEMRKKNNTNGYRNIEGVEVLPGKDRFYIKKSNVILFNLNVFDLQKPLLGTFFEAAWTYDDSGKIVIGIADTSINKQTQQICNHPFVKATINTFVENEEEACDLFDFFRDI